MDDLDCGYGLIFWLLQGKARKTLDII